MIFSRSMILWRGDLATGLLAYTAGTSGALSSAWASGTSLRPGVRMTLRQSSCFLSKIL